MPRGSARSLVLWSWIVLALLALHDVTHVLDDGLETPLGQLAFVAIPQWLALAVVMAVVLRGDRAQSRSAALLLGATVVVGFVVVHLLPLVPTAFWELQPSLISWVLAWLSTGAGLLLAVLAWTAGDRRAMRAPRHRSPVGEPQPGRRCQPDSSRARP